MTKAHFIRYRTRKLSRSFPRHATALRDAMDGKDVLLIGLGGCGALTVVRCFGQYNRVEWITEGTLRQHNLLHPTTDTICAFNLPPRLLARLWRMYPTVQKVVHCNLAIPHVETFLSGVAIHLFDKPADPSGLLDDMRAVSRRR